MPLQTAVQETATGSAGIQLRDEMASLRIQIRQISRSIGEAKKQGHPAQEFMAKHQALIKREFLLRRQIDALSPELAPDPAGSQSVGGSRTVPIEGCPVSTRPQDAITHPQVSEMSDTDADAWDAFVHSTPGATIYHLSAWRQVVRQAFGHHCPYLMARVGDTVAGVLPLVQLESRLFGNFMVSLPFFNYGGVLATDKVVRDALLKAAAEAARALGCTHMELRDTVPMQGWPARTDKITLKLDLPETAQELWLRLGSKLRAQIKKGQSHGLNFVTGGVELLPDFYRVFAENMRDLGTPVYSQQFFKVLLETAPGKPRLVVGRTPTGDAVSVALLVRHNAEMEIPWASTLRHANRLNANMALYWHVLAYACEQECTRFDFGRCTEESATHKFKKQWGALPVQLNWHYWLPSGGELPRLNPDNPKFKLAVAVWQRLPVWITRLIGPPLVKYLP